MALGKSHRLQQESDFQRTENFSDNAKGKVEFFLESWLVEHAHYNFIAETELVSAEVLKLRKSYVEIYLASNWAILALQLSNTASTETRTDSQLFASR